MLKQSKPSTISLKFPNLLTNSLKMKFFATVALLTTTVAAGPSEKLFNLKTSGASNSSHNNLYLSVGHGLISDPLNNEAIFSGAPASRAAAFSFVNGTVLLDTQTTAPWALDLINVEGTIFLVYLGIWLFPEPRMLTTLVPNRCPQRARTDQHQAYSRLQGILCRPPWHRGTQ